MTSGSPRRSGAELARIALEAADQAAAAVLRGFRETVRVQLKAGDEPFTVFDVESEQLLRRRLAELTPEIPVVGEEQGGDAGPDLTWYCDPIDGTVNFMRGQPVFAVSVGVARQGEPVAGAVVAPALGVRWHGSPVAAGGHGSYRNGHPCACSATGQLQEAVVSAGLPLRRGMVDASARWLGELASQTRGIRRCGSAAIELCMVADGSYDCYLSATLAGWDTCAGAAIARAAGAVWTPRVGPGASLDLCCVPALVGPVSALLGSWHTP